MNGLIAAMLGRREWDGGVGHGGRAPDRDPAMPHARPEPSLTVRNLRVGNKLSSVSFDAVPGEILGIVGLAGSGRTTLLRTLFGDLVADGGEVMLRGKSYRPRSPDAAMARGVFLIPEGRAVHGLMLSKPIAENIILPLLNRLTSPLGLLRYRRGRDLARQAMRMLDVRAVGIDQTVGELSGGNQQKIVLGKALLLGADILLLDEPSYGVDIGATQEIIRNVRMMAEKGATVLWVSSDLLEVSQVADRIMVLRDGEIGTILGPDQRDKFNEDTLLSLMQ
jgi:ABC-type sugar transport system ATPase subunit